MRPLTPPLKRGGDASGGRAEPPVKRDPAPSRWSYRLERMMLTPFYLWMLRRGLPLLVLGGLIAGWVGQESNRQIVIDAVAEARLQIEGRPEFQVDLMTIDGVDGPLADGVRAVLPVEFPISSFDLDLEEMRRTVVALDPVKDAWLRVKPGGVLSVEVEPRVPVAIWRSREGLQLLDAEHVIVGPLATRIERPDLPLIAGDGAADALEEGLAVFAAADPILRRVRGLVRMGERRWDLVLDRNQRVMLPAEDAVAAMERIVALHEAQDVLERDVTVVDFRNPARPTIRMAPQAVETLRDARAMTRTSGQ